MRGNFAVVSMLIPEASQIMQNLLCISIFPRSCPKPWFGNSRKVPGLLDKFKHASVSDTLAAHFQEVVVTDDVDAALRTFTTAFEEVAETVFQESSSQCLPSDCRGRAHGRLVPAHTGRIRALVDGSFATDRVLVGKRLRVVRWVLELAHARAKSPVQPCACCHILWRKICKAPGFPGGFRERVLNNDIVDFVLLSIPDKVWLCQVGATLRSEAEWWDTVVKRQKSHHTVEAMKVDWSSGGRCHARAIKDEQLLHSITTSQTVHVSPRRVCKGSPAKFTLVHGSESPVWSASSNAF